MESVSIFTNRVGDAVGVGIDLSPSVLAEREPNDPIRANASTMKRRYGCDVVVTVALLRNLRELHALIRDVGHAAGHPPTERRAIPLGVGAVVQRDPTWWRIGNWTMAAIFSAALVVEAIRALV